jgi:hypothetical protein
VIETGMGPPSSILSPYMCQGLLMVAVKIRSTSPLPLSLVVISQLTGLMICAVRVYIEIRITNREKKLRFNIMNYLNFYRIALQDYKKKFHWSIKEICANLAYFPYY